MFMHPRMTFGERVNVHAPTHERTYTSESDGYEKGMRMRIGT
jgi:hypothetical protein